jgi:hypothetical protein
MVLQEGIENLYIWISNHIYSDHVTTLSQDIKGNVDLMHIYPLSPKIILYYM